MKHLFVLCLAFVLTACAFATPKYADVSGRSSTISRTTGDVIANIPESMITASELYDHVAFLADDDREGRKPGTRGGLEAAEYIREEFRDYGLTLLANNGFQFFDVVTSVDLGQINTLTIGNISSTLEDDFIPLAFSANGTASAQVAFVGYGINLDDDSISWHDYDGIDVTDRWVIVLRGDPDPDNPHSAFAFHADLRSKALVANDHGATGVLFVSGEDFDPEDELIPLYYDQSQSRAKIPVLHIKRTHADRLLDASGETIAALEKTLIATQEPNSFTLEESVSATTDLIQNKVTTQNVIAYWEGTDPLLRDEVIVIGAHFDHLGYGGPHSGSRRPDDHEIHNGADDNASGVAGILEIAEQLAVSDRELKRSVLFVAFGAEEMGTLGSKHFVKNPPIKKDQIKCMLNLDMIGRFDIDEDALRITGTGTAVELSDVVETLADRLGLEVNLSPEGFGPSDHASFYVEDIPVLFFFTGSHEDYHTPSDDIDKVNFEGAETIARFIADVATLLANREQALVFQEAGPKERQMPRTRLRVTLGIMPDYGADNIEGLRVDAVLDGRPADLSGMEKGDVIVAIEGRAVGNIYDYMYRLAELRSGQRATVDVIRDGKVVVLIVDL